MKGSLQAAPPPYWPRRSSISGSTRCAKPRPTWANAESSRGRNSAWSRVSQTRATVTERRSRSRRSHSRGGAMPETDGLVKGGVDDHFFRRYRELLDAEDSAFDELEHAYEDGDRVHFEHDLAEWRQAF